MVKWSVLAEQDLKQIHDFIARDLRRYAQKVVMDIIDKSEALELSRNGKVHS